MKFYLTMAALALGTGLTWGADRKDVRLDNNRFIPAIITARVGDTYKLVVPALPSGRYRFFCTPQINGGMRGELFVVP